MRADARLHGQVAAVPQGERAGLEPGEAVPALVEPGAERAEGQRAGRAVAGLARQLGVLGGLQAGQEHAGQLAAGVRDEREEGVAVAGFGGGRLLDHGRSQAISP
ncbi:hypothetical protein D3C87_1543440 [compost metagenome]